MNYWCEMAWLGGESVGEGVTVEVEGDRIANVATGVSAPPQDATRLDGLTIPGLANAHSPRLPAGAARPDACGQRGLLELARADV